MIMSPGDKSPGVPGCGWGVYSWAGSSCCAGCPRDCCHGLDLPDKPATNSNPISLSTAGLGTLSPDLCRQNFWGEQIGLFFFFFGRAPYCASLFFHILRGFQGCHSVLGVEWGWNYVLLCQIFMIVGMLPVFFFLFYNFWCTVWWSVHTKIRVSNAVSWMGSWGSFAGSVAVSSFQCDWVVNAGNCTCWNYRCSYSAVFSTAGKGLLLLIDL